MDYSTFAATIDSYAGYSVSTSTNVDLDSLIDLAESRIYRDADFTHARRQDSGSLALLSSSLPLPDDMLVLRDVIITHVGTGATATLQPRDHSFLIEFWPDSFSTSRPRFYSQTDSAVLTIAPPADGNYTTLIYYTYRPAPLSASITTAWLATNYPDLLLKATMLELTTYHKGEQAQVGETPASPGFWQAQYEKALASARGQQEASKTDNYMTNR